MNAGDRVKSLSGRTFIVSDVHENGMASLIPDDEPDATYCMPVAMLVVISNPSQWRSMIPV